MISVSYFTLSLFFVNTSNLDLISSVVTLITHFYFDRNILESGTGGTPSHLQMSTLLLYIINHTEYSFHEDYFFMKCGILLNTYL